MLLITILEQVKEDGYEGRLRKFSLIRDCRQPYVKTLKQKANEN